MNFQVETSSYCDLSCGYCPNKDMERKRKFMSDEVFDTILHKYIVPYRHINCFSPPTFIPHKDGEILLNRNITKLIRRFADTIPDMKIDIYSHGLLLPKLAEQGKDFIEFLATLPNQVRYMMSYHPRNHDNTINDYGPVVYYLRKALEERKPANVEFITVSHKSKWVTDDDQGFWKNCWRGLPMTVHANCSINPWTGRMEDIATCAYNGCPYSDFGHWFFGATGNNIACCLDLEEEIVLGNVLEHDQQELFLRTSAFYAEQRRLLQEKEKHPLGVCRNCFGQRRDSAPKELVQLGAMI